jgi:hypothetical protein
MRGLFTVNFTLNAVSLQRMADVLSLVFDSQINGLLPFSLVIKSPFVARLKELNNY